MRGETQNQDRLVTHLIADKPLEDRAVTMCKAKIFWQRFYPLLWVENWRSVTCKRCLKLKPKPKPEPDDSKEKP